MAASGGEARARLSTGEFLAWLAVGGLLALLFVPQLLGMAAIWWDDPNYSHGFLVPLVSLGLIWRQRRELVAAARGPSPWGLPLMGLGLLVLALGKFGHEFYLQRVSLVPVLWGLCWCAFGAGVFVRVFFALGYLLLMVPLPYMLYDAVAFPLRLVAAGLAGFFLRLFGLPVLIEGNVVTLPWVVMNVVDACSGIRSLISLLAAGVILAYLMLPNRASKVVVVLLVLPVAVFTNALRVVLAGVLARWLGPAALEGAMHDAVGWAVFMVAFLILMGLTWLLKRALGPGRPAR